MLVSLVRVVLGLVLVAPLVVSAAPWPETLFPFVVGKAVWSRSLIEVAFGLWVVLILRDAAYRPPKYWLVGIFGVYLFLALMAGVFGVSLNRSLWSTFERMAGWVALAHWFVFVLMLISVFRTWAHWRWLLNFNVGVSLFLGLLGLSEYFDWGWVSYLQSTDGRVAITFGNPTYVGGYAAVNAFVAGALLAGSLVRRADAGEGAGRREPRGRRRARQRRTGGRASGGGAWGDAGVWGWRLFWAAALVLDLVMLSLSATRGAMAGLGMGLIAFSVAYAFWGHSRGWRLASAGVAAVLVGLAAGAVALVAAGQSVGEGREGVFWRVVDPARTRLSIEGRITANLVGIDGFLERPLLGWGPENFTAAYDRYAPAAASSSKSLYFDQAHNKMVEELTTKGVLGTLGYLAIWLYLLSVFVRKAALLEGDRRLFVGLIGAGLVCYFTQNLFLFDTPGTLPQLLVLMGFAVFVDSLPLPERDGAVAGRGGFLASLVSPLVPAGARVVARLRGGWLASGGRRGLAAARFVGLNGVAGMGLVAVLVTASVFFLNARVYSASNWALASLGSDSGWEEIFDSFENSVAAFPPLGNESRVMLFESIGNQWDTLADGGGGDGGGDGGDVLRFVERQGAMGIAAEPENHRLYAGMASVNQQASVGEPERLARARELVDRALELAPNRSEMQWLLAVQLLLEGDPEGGLAVVDRYLAEAPRAAGRFAGLRGDLERAIEAREEGAGGER